MANKLTKKDIINLMLNEDSIKSNTTYKDFLTHELELLEKKANGKASKASKENVAFLEDICRALGQLGTSTATEVMKGLVPTYPEISNQKVSAHLRKLVQSGKVVRTEEKGKAYFSLAEGAEVTEEFGE